MSSEINTNPAYLQIADILNREIRSGQFAPGTRFYSESKLSQRFGVSHVTIRQALRCLEEDELIERLHGKGTFVSDLHLSRGSIGLMVWKGQATLQHPAFSEIVRGVSEVLGDRGYHCNLLFITPAILERGRIDHFIRTSRVDGLIVPVQQITPTHLLPLVGTMPIVTVEQCIPDVTPYSVCCDAEEGYYRATRHLLEEGHRRIALMHAWVSATKIQAVDSGYARAIGESGAVLDPEFVLHTKHFTEEVGEEETRRLLERGSIPDAILTGDDYMAIGALKAIRQHGLRVPEDIAVVGYNDMPVAATLEPALTTVRLPFCELGRHSATMLSDILDDRQPEEEAITLTPELVVRESSLSRKSGAIASSIGEESLI